MRTLTAYFAKVTLCLCLCVSLSGCLLKPYRFDLEQGNEVTAEKIAQIQPGMSEEQVQYVLGTPMLRDVFHTQRWDYIYYDKPTKGKEARYHIAIHFNHGQVSEITRDSLPTIV